MAKKKGYPLTNEWRFGPGKAKKLAGKTPATVQPPALSRAKPTARSRAVECSNCKQLIVPSAEGTLPAHQWAANGQWCKAGAEPTKKQRRAAGKGRRSVFPVAQAGAPTLGKRG